MTRTVIFGLACLALGLFIRSTALQQASAEPATPEELTEFAEELGDTQAALAEAEAMVLGGVQDWRYDECRFQSLDQGLWTPREEDLTAACAVGKWDDVSLSTVMRIGSCESGWNRFANNSGNYLGLFQHAASSYVGRISQYGPAAWEHPISSRWTNSRGQIVMSVRMMNAVGLSPWSCA